MAAGIRTMNPGRASRVPVMEPSVRPATRLPNEAMSRASEPCTRALRCPRRAYNPGMCTRTKLITLPTFLPLFPHIRRSQQHTTASAAVPCISESSRVRFYACLIHILLGNDGYQGAIDMQLDKFTLKDQEALSEAQQLAESQNTLKW